ncbi:unnamed protein product [Blumeria hordei]|uniref:Alphavirus-like MT domain-containing protein n=1 Tax=Blumeria hordei TaxID=2867405 RepID=A0A383UMV1_BLUHO|nr:unnamed protein product [Blumeria hordei]
MRIIDHKLIASRIPNGVRVSDVGGNPLYHIAHANSHVHVCGHVHDKKDQMRNVMRLQAVKKKTMDSKVAVANMAAKYLERDKSFVCFEDARFCLHPTPILTSVHVYDIPLDHWPMIMEHKQAVVVEGCMIHSKAIFNTTRGDLSSIGARYEIDFMIFP